MSSVDKVVVVGAGVIGLCTTHFLHEAGFGVTVVEKNDGVAQEASHQNGAILAPSMSAPWNAPGVHWQLLKYLGHSDAPMLLRPSAMHHYLGWGIRFLRNSTMRCYEAAMRANHALSLESLERLNELISKFSIEFTHRQTGVLNVFREAALFDDAKVRADKIASMYSAIEYLDRDGVTNREPVLREVRDKIVGGICFPHDETGDAYEFSNSLQRSLAERGVEFLFGVTVTAVQQSEGQIAGVTMNQGEIEANRVVVAAAVLTPNLVPGEGIRIKPVKGYSIAVPIKSLDHFPKIAIVDDSLHAAVAPIGEFLRIAGTAEFCGWNDTLDHARVNNLWGLLNAVSPTLAANVDRDRAKPWCGFRPMSADGVPFIGETRVKGLYVNAGHGHLGWTQAAGSGALVASLLMGDEPSIEPTPYSVLR